MANENRKENAPWISPKGAKQNYTQNKFKIHAEKQKIPEISTKFPGSPFD